VGKTCGFKFEFTLIF